jgi:hypothetical protein
VSSERERERELERRATVQGFKYPWDRAWPDIVQSDRTLSEPTEHCPAQLNFLRLGLSVQRDSRLRQFSENKN